jgi:RNA polymerase sigma-70 factor, ECF subfamily
MRGEDGPRSAVSTTADEAMSQYGQGNDGAFEIVYEVVAPRLEGYLRRHVRETSRLEDIVQQTFENMHRARGSFIPGSQVLPWAFTIAKRLMIDTQRRTGHEVSRDLGEENDTVDAILIAARESGEEVVHAVETKAQLLAVFSRLPEMQQTVFEHVKIEGLPYAAVAAMLGITEDSVRMYTHRACKALRAVAGGEGRGTQND